MTSEVSSSALYDTEIQVFVKSHFIKKIITMHVKYGSTWDEFVKGYVQKLGEYEIKYSLDNFCEDFYGEFRVTSFNRRFKYNDFKDYRLCDMGLDNDKEIQFKKIIKEVPDTVGEKVLYNVFNHILTNFNFRDQQIIVSNNSFNITYCIDKNIKQQWQLNHIDKTKDDIIIVLWDKAFFHSLSENNVQIYNYIKLKELVYPNDKIRIYKKEKNQPIEMTEHITKNKLEYYERLNSLTSEMNLTDKQITWYVINFNDTNILPFNSIIQKVFSDKHISTDIATFCYFCGDKYRID